MMPKHGSSPMLLRDGLATGSSWPIFAECETKNEATLSLETDGNIRSGTAWTRWMNVERSIMHSNSQLTDCFVSLALRRAAHDCITGDGSSGAALRLC